MTKKIETLKNVVRENYAAVATQDAAAQSSPACCNSANKDAQAMSLDMGYSEQNLKDIPEGANMGLGCGNPQAIAALKLGETVLDLGSGGGFDCFLAAKEVGNEGHVIGVDMTHEMIAKARNNLEKFSLNNVEFRLGEIEYLPVADHCIDVIISNCVINLSPEKQKVFNEAFRVLKSGGRLAISDVVTTAQLPEDLQNDLKLYSACASGASSIAAIESMLEQSGFSHIHIKPKEESRELIKKWEPEVQLTDYIISASIEAIKP